MEELNRFVVLAQTGRFTLTELCEQFCIGRDYDPATLVWRCGQSTSKQRSPRENASEIL